MADLELTLACGDYELTRPLTEGLIKADLLHSPSKLTTAFRDVCLVTCAPDAANALAVIHKQLGDIAVGGARLCASVHSGELPCRLHNTHTQPTHTHTHAATRTAEHVQGPGRRRHGAAHAPLGPRAPGQAGLQGRQ